ncbi:MAG: secondary thiamine-phosphate synthase enzyme YjbQ [Methyloligellaceae bacterium]
MIQSDIPSFWENNLGQSGETLTVKTSGKGFYQVTDSVAGWLNSIRANNGLLVVFICHTSASLIIQENADPDVVRDLEDTLDILAPRNRNYLHSCEGPDDMPAHIRSMLTSTSLSIPVQNKRMVLGTWQGIFLAEHRDQPHIRRIALHFNGNQFDG